MDYKKISLELHKTLGGKISIELKTEIESKDDLSIIYSPGVAEPCLAIAKDESLTKTYTLTGNTIAIISDGSAVLGLGNIGAKASLPVMEGKCALFKKFAGINAFPIVINTQDTEDIIQTIKNIAPGLGGINLEDISAPRCFEIENRLKAELDIPVFHDDQHGTAIVCLAGLINSLKITGKKKEEIKVLINGVGAAGVAIAKLLLGFGVQHIVMLDSKGAIHSERDDLSDIKREIAEITNDQGLTGSLEECIQGIDVFLGVSAPGVLTEKMVRSMAKDPIIFAMANPIPEIMPELAYNSGAKIVATGRSDYPNQINNVLIFPGIFKGALNSGVNAITDDMKLSAAIALAASVENPSVENIIPDPFEEGIADLIAASIK